MSKTEFAIAKISTKGQIVIPRAFRNEISAGEEFLMVKQDGNIVLKKMEDLAEKLKEDIAFSKTIDSGWKEILSGKCTTMNKKEFLEELNRW